MRNKTTDGDSVQDGAESNTAAQTKTRSRKLRTANADGGNVRGPRRKKDAPNQPDVFGVHTALFERMQQQAELASIMKKHLEAMQNEFNKLNPGVHGFCEKLIEKIAQSGMDTLTNMNLVPKPNMLKTPESELKKAVENL